MKKIIKNIICFTLVCIMFSSVNVFAAREDASFIPKTYELIMADGAMLGIHNEEFTVLPSAPYMSNETLMIPLRYFFEALGYTVSWANGATQITGEKTVEIKANESTVVIDGVDTVLSESTQNNNGTTFIASDIAEKLGYTYTVASNGLFVVHTGEYNTGKNNDLLKLMGVYMSVDGKKSADGTPKIPINNFEAAKETAKGRAKLYGKMYPVYIFVKGGEYRFDASVTFDQVSFGDEDFKGVNVIGYDGKPVFTGATQLDPELLTPVTDAKTLARLPKAGRGKVAYLDLNTVGITHLSVDDTSFPYIYVNDTQQMQSRWPNDEFALVKSVPVSGEFCYEGVNPSRWTQANDIRLNGFFTADYFYGTTKVSNVDPSAGRIKTAKLHFSTKRAGARWYARNLLEEIDVPGEWYVDRENNILYFYPPYTLNGAKLEICTLQNNAMVNVGKARNISFENIKFTKSGGYAIGANGVNGLTVKNCDFTYLQGQYVINQNSGYNITIDGNYVYSCGGGFVYTRAGDVKTLDEGNVVITNNRVIACGYDPYYINGVVYGGYNTPARYGTVDTVIKNNIFQDNNTVYAVSLPGVDVKILNNEIVNQSKNIHDGGSIYVGRAQTFRGNEIAYNYIHHLNRDNFYGGLYNDDGYSGADWHHNILYDMNRPCIIGMGGHMKFRYNIAIDTNVGGTVGSRLTWGGDFKNGGALEEEIVNAIADTNKYLEKFPELQEYIGRRPFLGPWGSLVYGNVGIGSNGIAGNTAELKEYGAKTIERDGKTVNIDGLNGTRDVNPMTSYNKDLFVDADNQNWELKPDTDFAKQFPELLKIKMDEIGLSEGYENLIDNTSKEFKLRYPYNGQISVQTKEIRFTWDAFPGATRYKLVVATDPDLQNVVFEKDLKENGDNNSYTTSDLDLDRVYYWKVYAYGISRQANFVKESMGAPYGFKTAKKNELDKENLKLAIDSFTELYSEITSGDYNFDEEFVNSLTELLGRANAIYKTPESQEQIDALEEEIYTAVKLAPFYMVVEYKTPSFLTDPQTEWTPNKSGKVSYNGTEVTFTSNGERADAKVVTDTENEIVCFQAKLDAIGDGGKFQGFDYKMDANGKSYLFIFKETIFEFQKEGKYLMELPNFGIKPGEWFDVELGAVNVPGGVLQFAKIKGQVVFAALDQTPTQVRVGGWFRIRKSADGDVHLRPMEKLPESKILINEIYENFNNPFNATQLACMFTGVNGLIGMDNNMFTSLNLTKLAERVYPVMQDKGMKINGTDYTNYKNILQEYVVLEAYSQGKGEYLFKNNVDLIYNDITQFEKIDVNGVNLYGFAQSKLKDIDLNVINNATLNGEYNNFDELRFLYAKNVFIRSMNVCQPTFAADSSYMFDILTKANMDYLGIDISDYFTLTEAQKVKVHNNVGRNGASTERTLEEIVEEIHTFTKEAQ